MSDTAYLSWLLVPLLGTLGAVATLDAVVDPAAVYDLGVGSALAPHRADLGSRTAKSEAYIRGTYDVVVLGTSRAAVGFSPSSPVWEGAAVYNFGLPQSNVIETVHTLDWVLAHSPPDEILWVVDLLAFGDGRTTSVDFSRSHLDPNLDVVAFHADKLVGWSTLTQTGRTLRAASQGTPAAYTPDGQHLYQQRPSESPRAASLRWLERFLVNPATYWQFTYDPGRMELLGQAIERAEAAGVRVTVVVSPVHATLLETLREAGLWPTYERFLRDLAALGTERPVWSVPPYAALTSEALPADDTSDFVHYFEPSHYRPSLGAQVVTDVRSESPRVAERLTPATVASHLDRATSNRDDWRLEDPQGAEAVHRLAECVARWREQTGSVAQATELGRRGTPGCSTRLDP